MKLKHDKSRKPTLEETMRHREIVAGVAPGTYSRTSEVEAMPLRQKASKEEIRWLCGFSVGLAEVHRIGKHSSSVAEAARGALLTLASAKAAGVDNYDLQELQKAGVP
jgi:lactate dehydrogenase-like 2-hydroxyacid dehydrogenase